MNQQHDNTTVQHVVKQCEMPVAGHPGQWKTLAVRQLECKVNVNDAVLSVCKLETAMSNCAVICKLMCPQDNTMEEEKELPARSQ